MAQAIRGLRIKERVTIGGTALGAAATAFFMGNSNDAMADTGHGAGAAQSNNDGVNYDTDKNIYENMNDNEFKSDSTLVEDTKQEESQVPYATGMQPQAESELENTASEVQTHTFNLTDNKIVEQANATYAILKEMGLIDKDKFPIKPGIGATSSNMAEYLKQLQLTEEQQKAFQAKLDSGEFDKIQDSH